MSESQPQVQMLRIARGEPSDEELAALIAVLTALPNAAAGPSAPRSAWADPAAPLHRTPVPGRSQWHQPS